MIPRQERLTPAPSEPSGSEDRVFFTDCLLNIVLAQGDAISSSGTLFSWQQRNFSTGYPLTIGSTGSDTFFISHVNSLSIKLVSKDSFTAQNEIYLFIIKFIILNGT